MAATVFAQDGLLHEYRYDDQHDRVSFAVERAGLHEVMQALSKKQDIRLDITGIPEREVNGAFSGRTDRVIEQLLQTDNLVFRYSRTGQDGIRLSGVEALAKGKEDSDFLNSGKQPRTYYDDPEHMRKKEAQRKKRELRHSMGLGRVNNHAGEPEMRERKQPSSE